MDQVASLKNFEPKTTDGESKNAHKAVKQYLLHFISYQDDWAQLLPTTKLQKPQPLFNRHVTIRGKIWECLQQAQETMKCHFDKPFRINLEWKVGDRVWFNSCNI
ncbi:uncharacterized protein VP01_4846g1 [Puccinia sorghi]|uniref:Uncharacterized protein n=1 Tax=Puccinia sorghi TaxID=27349 RepID=A0A0L6UME3_9BASI|nr:uncharacterized protein VP01_4846g1 [Puccinia sorghi]